jgi:uncharacterized protein YycO
MVISPNYANDHTLFIGTQDGRVFRSSDGGVTWTATSLIVSNYEIRALAISPDYANDHTIFAGCGRAFDNGYNCGVYRSTDGGATWGVVNQGLIYQEVGALAISPNYKNDQTLFVTVWAGGVYRSTDGGTSWVEVNNGQPNRRLSALAFSLDYANDHTIFLGTWGEYNDGGVYRSTDGGVSWVWMSEGLTTRWIHRVVTSPNFSHDRTLLAGGEQTNGGGLWISIPCVSPNTDLDVCQLQRGDILLAKGQLNLTFQTFRMVSGTYWFHAALYLGDGKLAHATGPTPYVPNADQVKTDSIYDTYWWNGTGLNDWAVIRPSTTDAIKDQAAAYAQSKADQTNPDILYNTFFSDKDSEDKFYCSQLPWKAYKKQNQGPDLEVKKGVLTNLFGSVVTPDDLYYSISENKATLVEEKKSLTGGLQRGIFRIFSPADMLLVDPLGRRAGFDSATKQVINEIPNADYIGPDGEVETLSVIASDLTNGTWKLIITGTATGTYTLAAENVDIPDPTSQELALETSPGQVDTFIIVDPSSSGGELITRASQVFLPLIIR